MTVSDLLFDTPWWLPTIIIAAGLFAFLSGNKRTIPRLRMKTDYTRVLVEMARRRPFEAIMGTPLVDIGRTHIPGFQGVSFEDLMKASPFE